MFIGAEPGQYTAQDTKVRIKAVYQYYTINSIKLST